MKKKPLIRRIKQKIDKYISYWKYRNTIWCYDGSECDNCGDPECPRNEIKLK